MPQSERPAPPDDKRMTLAEHLEELRVRVLRSVIALGVALLGTMSFQDRIMGVMIWPHTTVVTDLQPTEQKLKAFSYPESFFTAFKMSLIAAAVLASPFIIYQIWRFISAGLYPKERRLVYTYAPISMGLFLAGALFGFFVLIPFTLHMLATYKLPNVEAMFNLTDYVNLVIILTLILGAVFELPLLMHFTDRLGVISAASYAKQRRLAVVIIVVVAAILTPTGDAYTLMLVSIPMYVLYELGILLCRFFPAKKEGGAAAAEGGAA